MPSSSFDPPPVFFARAIGVRPSRPVPDPVLTVSKSWS